MTLVGWDDIGGGVLSFGEGDELWGLGFLPSVGMTLVEGGMT